MSNRSVLNLSVSNSVFVDADCVIKYLMYFLSLFPVLHALKSDRFPERTEQCGFVRPVLFQEGITYDHIGIR